MGRALVACAGQWPALEVVGEVDLGDDVERAVRGADVVVDFSAHAVTVTVAELCREHGKGLVIGTTGHTDEDKAVIRRCAESIPMVWSANYSTGVNALFWLTRKAAAILGESFDLEVVEMHHRMKKDAPSGTAMRLAEILAQARKGQVQEVLRHGRSGLVGERTREEIGMHALRGGDVVGDHTVIFAGVGERLELSHKASSRDTFAQGALRAASWVMGKDPGIYDMQDVLGLK